MASPRDINPEDIKGVVYLDTFTPGKLNGIKIFTNGGHIFLYQGADLPWALTLVKDRFPPASGSTRMSDQLPPKD